MVNPYGIEVTKNFVHGDPAMIAEVPGTSFIFLWYGGAYIDMLKEEVYGDIMVNGVGYRYTDQNINVWDYQLGRASIPFGDNDSLITVLTEWMDS